MPSTLTSLTQPETVAHTLVSETAQSLREAWRAGDLKRTRMALFALAATLASPDDQRRALLVLAALGKRHWDLSLQADAFWQLADLERKVGNTEQAIRDFQLAEGLLRQQGLGEHAVLCLVDRLALEQKLSKAA